ncbi:MAG: hypothetical protein ACTTGZ_05395, partial [Treponema sp.]
TLSLLPALLRGVPLRTPKVIHRGYNFPVGESVKILLACSLPQANLFTVVLPHGKTTSGQQSAFSL